VWMEQHPLGLTPLGLSLTHDVPRKLLVPGGCDKRNWRRTWLDNPLQVLQPLGDWEAFNAWS
jgi:hypothetical protein